MAIPRGIYTFESVAFPGKMLNLYYNGSVANGQNVVLYTRDGSEEQKWRYYGGRLITMRNENFALDRYHTSNTSNQNNNNADVWAIADTDLVDQVVRVRMISDNIAVIILNDNEMVLKAVSSANGTNSGKTPQSSGNVYWSEPTENYDATQKWYITRVDVEDETDGGNGNGTLIVGQRPSTLDYNSNCYGQKFSEGQCTWHAFGRAIEVTGKTITFLQSGGNDAKNWWNNVTNCTKSSTPISNSIAVWNQSSGAGHVAYIEKVFSDGTIYYTEANADKNGQVDPVDGKVKSSTAEAMQSRSNGSLILLGYLVL